MAEQRIPTREELEAWLVKDIARRLIEWGHPDEAQAARLAVRLVSKVQLGPEMLLIDDYLAWLPEEAERKAVERAETLARDAEKQRKIAALDAEHLAAHGLTLDDDEDERCRGGCGLSRWDVLADMVAGCEGPDYDWSGVDRG